MSEPVLLQLVADLASMLPISSWSLSTPEHGQAQYAVLLSRLLLGMGGSILSAVCFIGAPRASARPKNDNRPSPYPTAF